MRKRIGISRASEEARKLIPLLQANPEVELAAIHDPDAEALAGELPHMEPRVAAALEAHLTADAAALRDDSTLYAIVDGEGSRDFAQRFPECVRRGVQIVTPLTARLLWGYGGDGPDRKSQRHGQDQSRGGEQQGRPDALGDLVDNRSLQRDRTTQIPLQDIAQPDEEALPQRQVEAELPAQGRQ